MAARSVANHIPAMPRPFFTIGHSNRGLEEFAALLTGTEIGLVADIRKIPMSRANPQFNSETLRGALADLEISYDHVTALGGRRGKARDLPAGMNGFWTNDSFHNYADYALSDEFRAGLDHLINEGRKRRAAMMCSEAVWWRCHRRIVTDHLIARGETVLHILGGNRLEPARMTAGAVVRDDKTVTYPAAADADR